MHHYSENPTGCNLSWIRARQIELTASLHELDPRTKAAQKPRDERVLQAMAYANALFYHTLNKYNVFDEDFKIIPENLYHLLNVSIAGELTGEWSTQYMSKHIAAHWEGAFFSENSIRVIRDFISGLGVFEFDKVAPGTTCKPPELRGISFIDLLLFQESLEIEYLSGSEPDPESEGGTRDRTLKDLPCKFGAIVRNVFNIVFKGVASYNRRDSDYEDQILAMEADDRCEPQPIPDENGEIDITPAAKCDWKRYFKEIWERINNKKREKNKNHAQKMKDMGIDPSLNKNPYGWWGAKPEY